MRPFNATLPILAAVCLLAILPAKKVSDHFLKLIWDDRPGMEIIKLVPSDEMAWTSPPQGDMWWIWQVYKNGDRLAWNAKPWRWKENTPPAAEYALTLEPLDTGVLLAETDGYFLYHFPENRYAWVATDAGSVPCVGKGKGGIIDVTCSTAVPGILNIAERNADGWVVAIDGKRTVPAANTYLALNLPAGDHRITLRFQPWDVPLGILLSLLGIGFSIWYILSDPSRKAAPAP
jgi:hypothetical protein